MEWKKFAKGTLVSKLSRAWFAWYIELSNEESLETRIQIEWITHFENAFYFRRIAIEYNLPD